jgi:hypothetical protein
LGKIKVHVNRASIDKETKSLQQEPVVVEKDMYMVYFPQGHSIRVDRKELERLGFHLKPRLVDLETGDLVDPGGDPYDFGGDGEAEDFDKIDVVDLDEPPKAKRA